MLTLQLFFQKGYIITCDKIPTNRLTTSVYEFPHTFAACVSGSFRQILAPSPVSPCPSCVNPLGAERTS